MTVESSQVFPVVEQDSQEPDSLNQENLVGSAGEGEHEALQQPGETFFPEPLFGGGTGSVLDPNGGVFEAPGSYSVWEEYAEQAFVELDDLMGFADQAPGESLFGGNSVDSGRSHARHKGVVFGGMQDVLDGGQSLDGMALHPMELQSFRALSAFPVGVFSDDDSYDSAPPQPVATSSYDPLFSKQWYIKNTSGGVDLNVVDVWKDFTGKGIKVGICDNGVEYTHPDFVPNYLRGAGYNPVSKVNDGFPPTAAQKHGTAVAGFIAAAKNGYGIQGISYEAKIASFLNAGGDAEAKDCFEKQTSFDISQNSWTNSPFENGPKTLEGVEGLARDGRGGLGTVVVFAGSNERELAILSDFYDTNNSPYAMSIGAVKSSGKFSDFSCAGPNLLATAPGSDVFTTDRVAPGGENSNGSHSQGSGTSYSSPMVSGVVALMMEANKNIGYRDVMEILASTAVKTSAMATDARWPWLINGAKDWNGGGMHASHDYGFGLVDAKAAVRLAESWDQGVHKYSNEAKRIVSATPNEAIPDNTGIAVTSVLNVGSDIMVQQALVKIEIDHENTEDLEITLTSPDGTVSSLLNGFLYAGIAGEVYNSTDAAAVSKVRAEHMPETFGKTDIWTFKTLLPTGEHGQGNWTLTVKDGADGDTGTLKSWTLTLHGDDVTDNDLYVFTDAFSDYAGSDAGRKTLTDTAGIDTINATSVDSDSSINLATGSVSKIDGVDMTIAAGTTIENAQTGDGNDTILGNGVDNALFGWRGNDVLSGLGGNDTLGGGVGADKLTGGTGSDIFMYKSSAEGKDTVADFSHADDCFNFVFSEFGQSSTGILASDHFFTSTSSVDVSDACFVFDGGVLLYDSDGVGATAAVEIAQVLGEAVQADDVVFV